MPKYEITAPDGRKFEITAPDGASQSDVMRYAQEQWKSQRVPSKSDKAASYAASAFGGLMDPIDGLAQLAPRAGEFVTSGGGFFPNPVSEWFGSEAKGVDDVVKSRNQAIEGYRQSAGRGGVDLVRIGGNIANPVNVLPGLSVAGKASQAGVTATNLAARGAMAGGLSAGMQPVLNTDNYLTEKLSQVGMGGVTGGIAAPVVGKLSEAIGQRIKQFSNALNKPKPDDVILGAFADAGLHRSDFTQQQMDAIRKEVTQALKVGKVVNPAALARKADFDALGVKGTSGQILRDPAQFSDELNLSKLNGVGDPLRARFVEQSRLLDNRLNKYAAGVDEPVVAGEKVISRLKTVDDQMSSKVSGLYKAARQSAQAADDVPMTGLAQDLGRIADDYEGSIPAGLLNRFKRYGFFGGEKQKVFDMQEAEKLLQAVNKYGDATDRAQQSALSELRSALKTAITEGADSGGPFASARKAAAARFSIQDAVPALERVSMGRADPDKFIDKYVMRAPVSEVKGMADLLDDNSRDAIRKMIGDQLRRAAFGVNTAGDNKFAQSRYNETLRKIGDTRLKVFFDTPEIAELKRIGRVAAYKESYPANSAVNTSNTTSALYNLARATGSGLFDQPLMNFLPSIAEKARQANLLSYSLTDGVGPMVPALGSVGRSRVGLLTGAAPVSGGLLLGSPSAP